MFMKYGKRVYDAKEDLEVEVLDEDCKKGRRKVPGACAAAHAMMREHDDIISAEVHRGVTYIQYAKKVVRYLTGSSLKFEASVYDRGGSFEPGTYVLHSPVGRKQSLENLRKPRATPHIDKRHRHDINKRLKERHTIPHLRPRAK